MPELQGQITARSMALFVHPPSSGARSPQRDASDRRQPTGAIIAKTLCVSSMGKTSIISTP
jgi:hypothetical protein